MLSPLPIAFIGGPEGILVLVLLLLLFGAKKLPALARGVGESIGEFKKARKELDEEEEKEKKDEKAALPADDKKDS